MKGNPYGLLGGPEAREGVEIWIPSLWGEVVSEAISLLLWQQVMWNIKIQGACWKGSWQGWAVGKSWRKGKGESGDLQMGGEEEKGVKGREGEEEEGKEEEKGYLEVTISFQWCKNFLSMVQKASRKCGL